MRVAELAVDLYRLALLEKACDLFFAKAEYRIVVSLLAAVAVPLGRQLIGHYNVISFKYILDDVKRSLARIEETGDRRKLVKSLLKNVYELIRCKWHKLYDEAACLFDGVVLLHENTKGNRCRNLLRCRKVISKIFGNLTGHELCLTDIRLLETDP